VSIRGWVYIIDNEAMPNILKIGYSTKDPTLRARELAGTGSPHSFRVVFDVLVNEPMAVEQATHAMLASKREGKEWFRCSHVEAIEAIRACAKSILIERNNSKEYQSSHDEGITKSEPRACSYYGCKEVGTSSYKSFAYCDEHHKAMRKRRFDAARSNIHQIATNERTNESANAALDRNANISAANLALRKLSSTEVESMPERTTMRKPNAAFINPMTPSAELAAIVGAQPMTRTEVTKRLWDYIQKNKLQDSTNPRLINPDARLNKIFGGKGKVSMFEMTKLVSNHLK